ncbi:MAG: 4-alpha-glucanotransferase [Actinomycetota bacterium]|nr:4-alpha-glucanotransferase [Actinomycetota bacterium]
MKMDILQLDTGLLKELAAMAGVATEYFDMWGVRREPPAKSLAKILQAMGFDITSNESVKGELERLSRPELISPTTVLPEGGPVRLEVNLPHSGWATFELEITDENGGSENVSLPSEGGSLEPVEIRQAYGASYGKYILEAGPRPAGYYTLKLKATVGPKAFETGARLIITPAKCFVPEDNKKTWGITLPLYSIRSERNWGIGDLTDLGWIIDWAAALGADFVGILPLHALPLHGGKSPYSPASRLFRHFLYLDLQAEPEFDAAFGGDEKNTLLARAGQLRAAALVDYQGVCTLKLEAAGKMFEQFLKTNFNDAEAITRRGMEFAGFMNSGGEGLVDFGAFMALSEKFRKGWPDWPDGYRAAKEDGVRKFKEENRQSVLFYCWLQWLLDMQLGRLARVAKDAGMRIGIYFDLAVGSLGGGADTWGWPGSFAIGMDAGAPPDNFSLSGQNWGFPPMSPRGMRENGYEVFIETIRSNLKYGGALRVDHALGLFRFFWIPNGMKPADGTYVQYPAADLLGIASLESQRQKAVIVAEDLGTIGEGVREALLAHKMLSYRLLYYERKYPGAALVPPDEYPEMAFCGVNTHDLPTLRGYWAAEDIKMKQELGLYPSEGELVKDLENRETDKKEIIKALKKKGLLADNLKMHSEKELPEGLLTAIYAYLAKTPCLMAALSLDDWLGSLDQQNMPGTISEYPNWMRKTPVPLETFTKDPRASEIAGVFWGEGRGRRPSEAAQGN